ncbi:endolytic transglycosylase MltG [Plantactinospora sp. KBS50]|uniref:endolytic transglycosylase MltG n=1 Tax=Plantactinospora sp. KBS50 TaxID=2024580 RepID=UPI000BAAB033|nr:endolytic transglycosylase MltG [Plantactinospora sp. KBS50]ASW54672.1 aminodeoxychorismate lyase [Plantactinospora sp. KBS50]
MIDELDLGFEDRTEKGRHRRGYVARRGGRKGGGRGRTVAALLMTLVLLGCLAGGAWYGFDRIQGYFGTPDYPGPGTGEAVVQVKDGDTITDVGNSLYEADVIKSAKAYLKAAEANSLAKNVGAGTYKLRKQMKAADALTLLLDPKSRMVEGVTVAEGEISLAIYQKLSKETEIPVEDFKKAAEDPEKLGVPDFWFKRTDGKKTTRSIEGFLYPATYEIPKDATAEQILRMMVAKFLSVTEELKFVETVEAERGGIAPYEALITASIAQAESVNAKDMGPVSRVVYNRVYAGKYSVCHCLKIDSAINYWLRLQGKDPKDSDKLKQSEINDPKNPYNTHDVDGLPITPISNPGEDALKGAMDPPASDNIFFVSVDKEGTMGYAKDDAGYRKLQETMCRNGVLTGENCR